MVLDENGDCIGTTEFIQYEVGKNSCDEAYPFKELEQVKNNMDKVIEIDKICLAKLHRGKNIKRILYTVYQYTKDNNIQYGIGLMEPLFYRTIKSFYGFHIVKLSEKKLYKGDWVIPVIIDFEYIHKDTSEFLSQLEFDGLKVDLSS